MIQQQYNQFSQINKQKNNINSDLQNVSYMEKLKQKKKNGQKRKPQSISIDLSKDMTKLPE